jgi:hypothetical protein
MREGKNTSCKRARGNARGPELGGGAGLQNLTCLNVLCLMSADIIAHNLRNVYIGGLVVRVLGYRSGGPGFDSRALQKK